MPEAQSKIFNKEFRYTALEDVDLMFCVYCGAPNPKDALYCHKCGRSIGFAPPAPQPPPEPPKVIAPAFSDDTLAPDAFNYFIDGFAHSSSKRRERTIREFANVPQRDPRVLESLEYLAGHDPVDYVRTAALAALSQKSTSPQHAYLRNANTANIQSQQKTARRDIGCGLLLLVVGGILTLGSLANAQQTGGAAIIFGGAILWGFIWLMRGLQNRNA